MPSFHNGQNPLQRTKTLILYQTTNSWSYIHRVDLFCCNRGEMAAPPLSYFVRCSMGSRVSGCPHSCQQRFKNDKISTIDSDSHRIGMPHIDCTSLLVTPQNGMEVSSCRMYFRNVESIQCRGKSISNGFQINIKTFVN